MKRHKENITLVRGTQSEIMRKRRRKRMTGREKEDAKDELKERAGEKEKN